MRTLNVTFFTALFVLFTLFVEGCTVVLVNANVGAIETRIEAGVVTPEKEDVNAPRAVR